MTRAILLTACGLISFGSVSAEPVADNVSDRAAYDAGRRDAARDIQQQRLIVEVSGLPAPWSGEYRKVLAEKYHIETKTVAGCIVDAQVVGHERGYNEISIAEIERRFGPNLLSAVAEEVQKKWDKEHQK